MAVRNRPILAVQSSNVVICAATGFAMLSALLALLPDRTDLGAMRNWSLRGTIAPAAAAATRPGWGANGGRTHSG